MVHTILGDTKMPENTWDVVVDGYTVAMNLDAKEARLWARDNRRLGRTVQIVPRDHIPTLAEIRGRG